MKLVRAPLLLVLLLLPTALACDDGTSKGTNSNTNWLLACETSVDCAGAWDCLCGVCTATCDEDSCTATGGVCTAADALAHGLQCGDSEASAVCLRGCDDGGEACADDQVCVNGVCSPRPEPASCSEHDDALFCSGFESELDAGTLVDGGELAQTTEEQLGGEGALVAAVRDPAYRSRARYDFEPQTEGTLYLRTWLYLDVDDVSDLHVHTLTIGSVDTEAYGTDLHIDGGKLGLSFPIKGDVAGDVAVLARTWFCVRLEIALGADDGAASVWLNDELSAEASDADTLPPEGAVNISVGIDAAGAGGVRLLVDDLVLATTPVACDR